MFLPFECYIWVEDWEDDEEGGYWEESIKNININHVETYEEDVEFGDYTHIMMITGREFIIKLSVVDFEKAIEYVNIRPLKN